MSSVAVSVVVPFRNGARTLPRLFAALEGQSLPPDRFEVLLVDDASTDAGTDVAHAWAHDLPERRRVIPGTGAGPASARNLGIEHARGEWIASTDCDIVPAPDWLERGLERLEASNASALEGAITVFGDLAGGAFPQVQRNLDGGRYMTGNMFYRRSLLEKLGGFDQRFGQQFLEDSDLGFRILEAGHSIPFAPDVRVAHPAVTYSFRQTLRLARRSQWFALFAARHPELYRTHLRPLVRPVEAIDLDVILGLGALAALPSTRGAGRVALAAVAANGLKRGLVEARVHNAETPNEAATRAAAAVVLPAVRVASWLAGCVRFRKLVR